MTKEKLKQPDEKGGVQVQGHIKIFDPNTGEILVNKRNAIHYENMSEAIAQSLGSQDKGPIHSIHFGNGGTAVDPTGVITYLPTKGTGAAADLYHETYYKIIDGNTGTDSSDSIEISHTPGLIYTDIVVHCLLDYGQPADGQGAFDNASNFGGEYTFDELGLKSYGTGLSDPDDDGNRSSTGKLLTHVVFHPVQKSLNRVIQIDYTVRIQTLTNLGNVS